MIEIKYPDNSRRVYESGVTAIEAMKGYTLPTDRALLAAEIDGVAVDLSTVLTSNVAINPLTFDSALGKEVYWHTSAHILAQAVQAVFPSAKLAIGPPIDTGFYYDFDFERPFTPEDLTRIEEEVHLIMKEDYPLKRIEFSQQDAIPVFQKRGEGYKVEIIESIDDPSVSMYQQGNFIDLCRGPHVSSTGQIGAFKVLSGAGAYWRGDERNPMLQRIYGVSFPTQKELDQHLILLEEAKRRDHRKLGKELGLFSVSEETGPGLILWHPKGAMVRHLIETFWREQHIKRGYEFVYSPHIARRNLWKQSGHLDFYQENMFAAMSVENNPYQLKPMNCPFHIMIYKSSLRSYRDLPLRWAELGTVYRYERSGVLHGLFRVRGFTQDDAHIFCRPAQLADEVASIIKFTFSTLRRFGFEYFEIFLSTRPDHAVGSDEDWQHATDSLKSALELLDISYTTDPGEGVFYGPKIDIKIRDVLGRAWQCSTIQLDFNLPLRFGLSFIGPDGKPHQPIMIHRALLGSVERFMGILIEHFAGAFPSWLAPIQVKVLTLGEAQTSYANDIMLQLAGHGLRAEADLRSEKMNLKIREAETAKIPYMLVVGDKEVTARTVSIRKRTKGQAGTMKLDTFIEMLKEEILEHSSSAITPTLSTNNSN